MGYRQAIRRFAGCDRSGQPNQQSFRPLPRNGSSYSAKNTHGAAGRNVVANRRALWDDCSRHFASQSD